LRGARAPGSVGNRIPPIEAIIGSAISARDAMGKLVILIEGSNTGALLDQMAQIRKLPGVLNIEMVYQHAEAASVMKALLP
jgi:nitrate reductase NapAB chaperone NapD